MAPLSTALSLQSVNSTLLTQSPLGLRRAPRRGSRGRRSTHTIRSTAFKGVGFERGTPRRRSPPNTPRVPGGGILSHSKRHGTLSALFGGRSAAPGHARAPGRDSTAAVRRTNSVSLHVVICVTSERGCVARFAEAQSCDVLCRCAKEALCTLMGASVFCTGVVSVLLVSSPRSPTR